MKKYITVCILFITMYAPFYSENLPVKALLNVLNDETIC